MRLSAIGARLKPKGRPNQGGPLFVSGCLVKRQARAKLFGMETSTVRQSLGPRPRDERSLVVRFKIAQARFNGMLAIGVAIAYTKCIIGSGPHGSRRR